MEVVINSVSKNWTGWWAGLSIFGLILSVMFGWSAGFIASMTLSSILSGITASNNWGGVLSWFGKAMSGKYGYDVAALVAGSLALFFGILMYYINPTYSNELTHRPLESSLFGAGWLLVVGSMILFVKRLIKDGPFKQK